MKNKLFLSCLFTLLVVSCGVGNNAANSPKNNTLVLDSLTTQSLNYNQVVHNVFANIPPEPLENSPYGNCSAAYQDESLLTPPDPKCDLNNGGHTQIANGCTVTTNSGDSLGARLARSVVAIAIS